jgi:DNA polymerase-3 subunit beta
LEIICTQSQLKESLDIVKRAAPSKSTLPVLGGIVITAGDSVELKATNLEMYITRYLPSKVKESGVRCIPATVLSEFVSTLPDDQVVIKGRKDGVNIKCGRSESNIKGYDPEEFPEIPSLELTTEVDADSLKRAINLVSFAAAQDDSRPVLTGIYIDDDTVVAADGFRLSLCKTNPTGIKAIIPAKSLRELAKAAVGTIKIGSNANHMAFQTEDTRLGTRLIEGQFPPYERVLPQPSGNTLTVSVGDLLNVNKVASIFARENSNIVRLTPADGKLVVSAVSVDSGDSSAEIDAVVTGTPSEVKFNAKYLDEMLRSLDKNSRLVMDISSASSPSLFTVEGDDSFKSVLMPMNPRA